MNAKGVPSEKFPAIITWVPSEFPPVSFRIRLKQFHQKFFSSFLGKSTILLLVIALQMLSSIYLSNFEKNGQRSLKRSRIPEKYWKKKTNLALIPLEMSPN